MIKILAIDPAIRNLGLARMQFDPGTSQLTVVDIMLVTTESESGKTVRKNSDDLRRARLLQDAIKYYSKDMDIVMAEVPVGTQSARGAMSNGICIGLIAAINKPIIEVTPSEAKMASIGRKTASKEEIIDWAFRVNPDLDWKIRWSKGVKRLTHANEHMADAIAIGHAGIKTSEFKNAVAMVNAISGINMLPRNGV